jgi:hypothetical protein
MVSQGDWAFYIGKDYIYKIKIRLYKYRVHLSKGCVMTFAPFLQVNFLIVRPRFCKTDFVHTAIAPCILVLLPRALMVLRTFLIQPQNLSPRDSNI